MIYSRTELLLGNADIKLPLQKRVAIIGCGGVGTPAALYLASIVQHIDLYDYDVIEEHNLNRQIAYVQTDIGKSKAQTLTQRLKALNPECTVTPVDLKITDSSVVQLRPDILIDATDNADARFTVAMHCHRFKIPHIYASANMFQYNVAIFNLRPERACFRCILGQKPPPQQLQLKSSQNGIFGPAAGICGAIAASQCFFYFTSRSECLSGLLLGDVRTGQQRVIPIAKKCQDCTGNPIDV